MPMSFPDVRIVVPRHGSSVADVANSCAWTENRRLCVVLHVATRPRSLFPIVSI